MAGEIFISYRRADEAWARLLHSQLRAEGVEAWYDAHVGAGQDWRIATARALQASQIFVLLFSANAAESSDIAKELAAAVFEKKLIIPVRLEDIAPDGAFLYELASRNWVNAYENTEAKLAELARGLAQLVRTGARDESIIPFDRNAGAKAPARKRGWLTRTPLAIAAAAALVMAVTVAALFWLYPKSAAEQIPRASARVAVLPFDTLSDGSQARHFADALTDEIVTTLNSNSIQVVSRDDAGSLRGLDRDRKVAELGVALLFDGTVQDDGKTVKVRVHLDDPIRHATLWSGSIDGPADNSDQLQASIASTIVAVLACSNRALEPAHGLTDPDLLSHYLHACDLFVNGVHTREDIYELLGSLREVTAKAPAFIPAHSDFAKFALYLSVALPPEQAAPLREEGKAEAYKALALDPKSPDAFLTLSWLLPPTDYAGREKLLRQGLAGDPNWPHTNGFLGNLLVETGRLRDAAGYLQKAAAANLQIDWRPVNASQQCGSGDFEPATSYLFGALKRKPRDIITWSSLLSCLKYARRWSDLRTLVDDSSSRPASFTALAAAQDDIYLAAEQTGAPEAVAHARSLAISAQTGESSSIEVLSVLGFIDDAFAVAQRYKTGGGFLFSPLTAPLRRDPRFMQLAKRYGLVNYWRSSGKWPDFCADPSLPYNCRTEANRFAAAK